MRFLFPNVFGERMQVNAYKNLGISLEGEGQFAEAAKSYIRAVQINAADPRALIHLEDLVANHNEILSDMPDIQAQIDKCREFVYSAQRIQDELDEESHREADE